MNRTKKTRNFKLIKAPFFNFHSFRLKTMIDSLIILSLSVKKKKKTLTHGCQTKQIPL